jgi:hypothetical protein
MKTCKITVTDIKDPDNWRELQEKLDLDYETFSDYIEYGDYANIELEVDEEFNIIGGKFLLNKK